MVENKIPLYFNAGELGEVKQMAYEKFTGEEYIDTDLVAKLNQDFDACGKLASNNTWTGDNYWNGSAIFNASLTIRGSATTPGDASTYLWLGTPPEGSEQVPSICRNKIGDLVMYAADYRPCYLRSGIQTSFASVYKSDGTVEFSSLNNTPWGKYTGANGLELKVHKTPTVNNDVPNKKYVDDSVASAVSGCAPAYTYSTTDLTAGSSALTTGTLYIVYE